MTDVQEQLRRAFTERADPGRALDDDTNFFEAGFTSIRLAELVAMLTAAGIEVEFVDVFRYPTLRTLADELSRRTQTRR